MVFTGTAIRMGGLMLALAAIPFDGLGQVGLRVRLEQSTTLQYEPVRAIVTITNDSGVPIVPGTDSAVDLSFLIERKPGYPVKSLSASEPIPPIEIGAWSSGRQVIDLNPHYDIRSTGPYSIVARLKRGNRSVKSGKLLLDVVPGYVVSEMKTELGDGQGSRTYSLRALSRGGREHLFLRIEDPSRKLCYGVHGLGRMVRQGRPPQTMIDVAGRFHVLHQSSPTRGTHTVAPPRGWPLDQTTIVLGGAPARLVRTEDGDIEVEGGTNYAGETNVARPVIRPFDPFSTED